MKRIKNSLIILIAVVTVSATYSQQNGFLGVALKPVTQNGEDYVRVAAVFENTSAEVYGIKENDLLTHVNGLTVSSRADFIKKVKGAAWGEEVSLTYIRNGITDIKKVVLGKKLIRKTYNITLRQNKKQLGIAVWTFDKDVIIITKNGVAQSMSKLIEGNRRKKITITNNKQQEFDQEFMDFYDKKTIIEELIERYRGQKPSNKNIVFKRDYTEKKKEDKKELSKQIDNPFSVYPNPSTDVFKVKFSSDIANKASFKVFDTKGMEVLNKSLNEISKGSITTIDLTILERGTYLLQLIEGNTIYTEKLTKL